MRAITEVGHVVQRALERVMDGRPADTVDLETLAGRASQRLEKTFADEWRIKRDAFATNPNALGTWDLDFDHYEAMARRGLHHHIHEVSSCLRGIHPHTGVRLTTEPPKSVAEAWKVACPWHVDPKAPPFSAMEIHPGGWLQGEPDLVYTWTGARRIIDLKASTGSSPFSTEIDHQLLAYAYLDRALGRGIPEGLEAWFLGKDERYHAPVPTDGELDAFETRVHALIDLACSELGFGQWNPGDFPAEPAQVPGFTPAHDEPSAWCGSCPANAGCQRSTATAPSIGDGVAFDAVPDHARVDVEGRVVGIGEPQEKPNGELKRRFSLVNESGYRSFTWKNASVEGLIRAGLRAGATVRLTELRPWTASDGAVLLFDSYQTQVELI